MQVAVGVGVGVVEAAGRDVQGTALAGEQTVTAVEYLACGGDAQAALAGHGAAAAVVQTADQQGNKGQ